MNDKEREKMRKRYQGLMADEAGLAADVAHAFEGAGASCTSCSRWRAHPFHLCPRCRPDVELDANAVCPSCGDQA